MNLKRFLPVHEVPDEDDELHGHEADEDARGDAGTAAAAGDLGAFNLENESC